MHTICLWCWVCTHISCLNSISKPNMQTQYPNPMSKLNEKLMWMNCGQNHYYCGQSRCGVVLTLVSESSWCWRNATKRSWVDYECSFFMGKRRSYSTYLKLWVTHTIIVKGKMQIKLHLQIKVMPFWCSNLKLKLFLIKHDWSNISVLYISYPWNWYCSSRCFGQLYWQWLERSETDMPPTGHPQTNLHHNAG